MRRVIALLAWLFLFATPASTLNTGELRGLAALYREWYIHEPKSLATWAIARDPCLGWAGVVCQPSNRTDAAATYDFPGFGVVNTTSATLVALEIAFLFQDWLGGATFPNEACGALNGSPRLRFSPPSPAAGGGGGGARLMTSSPYDAAPHFSPLPHPLWLIDWLADQLDATMAG